MQPNVLVVDDEREIGRFFEAFLSEEKGCRVTVANTGRDAREELQRQAFDLALLDLKLPDANGIELLREIKQVSPRCQVIIMTGFSTVKSAVEAVKLGACDYVNKPFDELEELEETLDHALAAAGCGGGRRNEIVQLAANSNIVLGVDSPMQPVLEVARRIANKDITVLLSGATGTGKECVARFIHSCSRRSEKPFITVNCGAFTETLLASQLFGHEKGAFTGAAGAHRGIFELADGGTLFLDEIGEASPANQVKLLRVLETREFRRVGGELPIRVDVRVISATNVDLMEAVEKGSFRKDLFYRLDVVSLSLPPLRDRTADIEALMRHFVDKSLPPREKGSVQFSPSARAALLAYHWPGNVRELANVVAGMMALREGPRLETAVLPGKIAGGEHGRGTGDDPGQGSSPEQGLEALSRRWGEIFFRRLLSGKGGDGLGGVVETLKQLENRVAIDLIQRTLERTGGDREAAAALLRVKPRILRYYLRERGR
ncbi:MAG TPA: sigma-54 dependent transcriptional regulator [Deferrisomatales bacterium]|nr:sigma-54 dependent transcriptional regulator [Deferrisomatales bacterium]